MLATQGMGPWRLERTADGDKVILATRLPEPDYPQQIRALREQLRDMVAQDQDARLAFNQPVRRKELFMPPVREYLQMDYLIKSWAPSKS